MNADEIKNFGLVFSAAMVPIAAKYGIDAGVVTQVISGLVFVGLALYTHWNMKKVPEGTYTPPTKGN